MYTRFKYFGLLFLCLASCGPSQIQLYTYSYPAGASVTQQGKVIGEDGNSLYYNITDAHREQGYIEIQPVRAKWPSGATSEPLTRLNLSTGYTQQITFQRPSTSPNLQKDLDHANNIKLQRQLTEMNNQRKSQQSLLMMQQGLKMMQGNSAGNSSSRGTAFLESEYTQGFNKICIYNRLGSVESLTISSTALCPLSK